MVCFVFVLSCFFFKQKTAYVLPIRDWSSALCPSDLAAQRRTVGLPLQPQHLHRAMFVASEARVGRLAPCLIHALPEAGAERIHRVAEIGPARRQVSAARGAKGAAFGLPARGRRLGGEDLRSEEHTSELQSLMA